VDARARGAVVAPASRSDLTEAPLRR
jgi:hypothetical protein